VKDIPETAESYKSTPEFNEDTVPPGLLKAHQTKQGTWGKINVNQGKLLYRILEPAIEEIVLSPSKFGVVEPTVLHEVLPQGKVSFHVEFFREP